jgi:biotin operon repressor
MAKLTKSIEDYLETILVLEKESSKTVKSVDIALNLSVSKPAVTKAMNELKQLGYINSSTQIAQMADKIETTVSSVNGIGTRMSTAESKITQNANSIATKVDVNGVKSTIQQNPESVRIGFNGISSYFDLNSTRLQVGHSDGSYTQIGQNGIVYYDAYANWKYHSLLKQGWIGAVTGTTWSRTITLPSSFKGKVFSVIVSVAMVAAVNTHDVIKHFQVTVPHDTVNYANGTFVINVSALAYYVPGQQSATAIQTDISWIAIA